MAEKQDNSGITQGPAHGTTGRDPEDRTVNKNHEEELREKVMTDSYPASDPPSSIPDPAEDDSAA